MFGELPNAQYIVNTRTTNLKVFEFCFSVNDLFRIFAVNANQHAIIFWTRIVEQTDQLVSYTICEQLMFYTQYFD